MQISNLEKFAEFYTHKNYYSVREQAMSTSSTQTDLRAYMHLFACVYALHVRIQCALIYRGITHEN